MKAVLFDIEELLLPLVEEKRGLRFVDEDDATFEACWSSRKILSCSFSSQTCSLMADSCCWYDSRVDSSSCCFKTSFSWKHRSILIHKPVAKVLISYEENFEENINKTAGYQRHILRLPVFLKKASKKPKLFLEKAVFLHHSFQHSKCPDFFAK